MGRPVAWYREFAPGPALREHVRAFFCAGSEPAGSVSSRPILREVAVGEDDPFSSPLFADGNVSLVFSFGRTYGADHRWRDDPAGRQACAIGAMNAVGESASAERSEMLGVYFRGGRAAAFLGVAASELTDRIVPAGDLWGPAGADLHDELSEADEAARLDRLESALLERVGEEREAGAVDVPGLAALVNRRGGRLTVEALADAAGVSRQRLTRVFRERVGVTPKTYCRLARFHAGLAYAGCGDSVDWAQAAVEGGYADQSHMIAEFRRFSSLTPQVLARGKWFHPFIERAKARRQP
jgi:AraC-like DNA-binding protein